MSARRVIVALLLIATGAAGAAAGGALESGEQPAAGDRDAAAGRVVKVVDGDTIHVQVAAGREKVRYIGVDTPVLWSRRVIPSTAAPVQRR